MSEIDRDLRLLEALIFASAEPVDEAAMRARLPEDVDLPELLAPLGSADQAIQNSCAPSFLVLPQAKLRRMGKTH